MGKNKQLKDEAPNPNSVANREIFQRLNFLYQASAYLKRIEPSPLDGTHEHPNRNNNSREKHGKRRRASLGELGGRYVQSMRNIGNKSVTRVDPNVKRTLCKGCDTVLFPGTTAAVRVRRLADKEPNVVHTCLACHNSRIIPARLVTLVPSSTPPTTVRPKSSFQPMFEALEEPISSRTQIPLARPKKPKRSVPHPLPLFARRDAGHVVFRGNEVLEEQ